MKRQLVSPSNQGFKAEADTFGHKLRHSVSWADQSLDYRGEVERRSSYLL